VLEVCLTFNAISTSQYVVPHAYAIGFLCTNLKKLYLPERIRDIVDIL
jgi:hypothetical protein